MTSATAETGAAEAADATLESVPGPVDVEADQTRADAVVLSAPELGDWTRSGAEPSLGVLGECARELVGSDLGVLAEGSEFWNPDGLSLTSVGLVLGSISDASGVFGEVTGELFQQCVLERLPPSFEPGVRMTAASVSSAELPALGEATGGMRFVFAFASDSEPALPSRWYDVVWVWNGREMAGMLVSGAAGEVSSSAIPDGLVQTLAAKVGAAPNEPAAEAETTEAQTQTQREEPAEENAVVAADLEGTVRAWYEQADPAVCGRMTDAMLDFGWGLTGDAGRQECLRNLGETDPAAEVVVKAAKVDERRATVEVSYAAEGGSNVDRVTFVLRGGQWLINRVRLVGFE